MNESRIVDILAQIEREVNTKADITIDPHKIAVNEGTGRLHVLGSDFDMTEWAEGQFCNRIGIPTRYYRLCPPDLKAENANYWIKQLTDKSADWMLRVRQAEGMGIVRGVLTEKYSPFDDHEIMDVMQQLIGGREKDLTVERFWRDDTSMHLRVTFSDMQTAVGKTLDGKPDIHKVGFHLSNSEVGKRSIKIQPMVYRLVCTNGLMAWKTDGDIFHQRHVGLKPHEMYSRVADALAGAVKAGDEIVEALVAAKQVPIADPFAEIERIAKNKRYSERYIENVKQEFMIEPMKNAFGVVQSFTAAARRLPDDYRLDMETDAGNLLRQLVKAK